MNDKNKEFLTPLHLATDKSHYDVMELLLKHGAKVRNDAFLYLDILGVFKILALKAFAILNTLLAR